MRARLFDRRGPRTSWLILLGLAALSGLVAILALLVLGSGLALAAWLASLMFGALAALAPARFAPREVELELAPGQVRVRGSSLLAQTVRAREVMGASTARHGEGFVVSVQTVKRAAHPLSFLVQTQEEAARLRVALGIGHDGEGELAWRAEEPVGVFFFNLSGWLSFALSAAGLAYTGILVAQGAGEGELSPTFTMGVMPLLFSMLRLMPQTTNRVLLRGDALYIPWIPSCARIEYWDIAWVGRDGRALVLTTRSGHSFSVAMKLARPEEIELVASQIDSARRRAQGEGTSREHVGNQLSTLERGQAPLGVWLARLDGLAAGLMGGYRGSALDRGALWLAVEDPDMTPELRVAAARVLGRLEPAQRTRIADLAEASRSPAVAKGIRVASEVDATDSASQQLEETWSELEEAQAATKARLTF